MNDFNLLKLLGKGINGKVYLGEKKDTKELFALKTLSKANLNEKAMIDYTKTERYILGMVIRRHMISLASTVSFLVGKQSFPDDNGICVPDT